MTDENKEEFRLNAAMRFQLKDLKVEEKEINAIRSNDEAKELIEYLHKKENKEPDNKEKMLKLKENQGTKPLPKAEVLNDKLKLNEAQKAEIFMNPLHPLRAQNNRWNSTARILPIWDGERWRVH